MQLNSTASTQSWCGEYLVDNLVPLHAAQLEARVTDPLAVWPRPDCLDLTARAGTDVCDLQLRHRQHLVARRQPRLGIVGLQIGASVRTPAGQCGAEVCTRWFSPLANTDMSWRVGRHLGDASPPVAARRVSKRAVATGSVTDQSRSCSRTPGVGPPRAPQLPDATVDSPRDCRQHGRPQLLLCCRCCRSTAHDRKTQRL